MKTKCNKHGWHKIDIVQHKPMDLDLSAGAVNLVFPKMTVEICINCSKIRNVK